MMSRLFFLLTLAGTAFGGAQTAVSFEAVAAGGDPIEASSLDLGGGRLAAIAVVGAKPDVAKMTGSSGGALKLEGHDPVTRLTILKGASSSEASAAPLGSSLDLHPGDELFLSPDGGGRASRVVKWETSYQGKVLPVALIRVHHAGTKTPLPGTPLYNAEGEVVAICHQPASQFGNGTFALPVEVLKRVESDLMERGKVSPCWIGITVNASDPVLAVEMVRPSSPGSKAGIRKGDILLTVGLRRVSDYAEARNAFYYLVAGGNDAGGGPARHAEADARACSGVVSDPR